MKPNKFLQFKKLPEKKILVHGIFDKTWGNFSLEHGDKNQVLANKKRIARVLHIDWQRIFSLHQIHGSKIKIINQKKKFQKEEEADALITNKNGVFLMIKTADCFPVLMFDPKQKVVAAVHVGWRGAMEKIFIIALLKMINKFGSQPADILVAIGSGISSCCFKHKNLVQNKLPEWQPYIKKEKNGFQSLNLLNFIKDQLVEAGVQKNNIESLNICTNCDKRFFSHFRSLQKNEPEGRFASLIGLK